jgi:hypothetical protein
MGVMYVSQRYRDNAAECLSAAQATHDLYYRKLHLSMAESWMSLARQDEATSALLASWSVAEPVKTGELSA